MLYLVVSGAPAPEGIPALVAACQAAGWQVVVFSTPTGIRFIDPAQLEQLTGKPVRSEYRMPGTGTPVPPADAVLACPLTFNSVNKFAHGHADNFAVGLLCEMAGYGVPVVVVPHCKPQLASHPAVVIGAGNGWWQALIPELNGEMVTTRYTLRALLDKLDELLSANRGQTPGRA